MPNTPRKTLKKRRSSESEDEKDSDVADIPITDVLDHLKRRQPLLPYDTLAAPLQQHHIAYTSILLHATDPLKQLQAAEVPEILAKEILMTAKKMVRAARSTTHARHSPKRARIKKENDDEVIDLTRD
jgi:hypothetical protein